MFFSKSAKIQLLMKIEVYEFDMNLFDGNIDLNIFEKSFCFINRHFISLFLYVIKNEQL